MASALLKNSMSLSLKLKSHNWLYKKMILVFDASEICIEKKCLKVMPS